MNAHASIDLENELTGLVATCAGPQDGEPLSLLDSYCGAILLTLLRRTEAIGVLDAQSRAICAYVESCLLDDGLSGRSALWSPAIASLRHKIAAGQQDAALAQLLWIVCALIDKPCHFVVRSAALCSIYHRGTCTELPAATEMDFAQYDPSIANPVMQVLSACPTLPEDALQALQTRAEAAAPLSFHWTGGTEKFAIPTREFSEDDIDVEIEWPPVPGHGVPARLLTHAVQEIGAAHAGIARNSGAYALWVERLIAGFAVTQQASAENVSNGSYISRPGLVHCAFPVDPLVLAETLVHEASHQHFMLLNSIVPLVEKDCTQHVYSPIKGQQRPLARALFAYHACTNIHGYFAGIADIPEDERIQCDLARDYCVRFAAELGSASGLTRHGRALCDLMDARL